MMSQGYIQRIEDKKNNNNKMISPKGSTNKFDLDEFILIDLNTMIKSNST